MQSRISTHRSATVHGVEQPIAKIDVIGLGSKVADLIVCAPIRGHHRRQQKHPHFRLCSWLVYRSLLVTSVQSMVMSAKRRMALSGSLSTCGQSCVSRAGAVQRHNPTHRSTTPHSTRFDSGLYTQTATQARPVPPASSLCDLHNHGHRRACRIQPPLWKFCARPHSCVQ